MLVAVVVHDDSLLSCFTFVSAPQVWILVFRVVFTAHTDTSILLVATVLGPSHR